MRNYLALIVVATVAGGSFLGCAAPAENVEPVASEADDLAAVDPADDQAFRDALRELHANVEDVPVHTSSLAPQTAGGLANVATAKLCGYLKPLARNPAWAHPYFFVGGTLHAAGVVGVAGGVDAVWDLYNQQAAAFTHSDRLLESGVSVGATGSVGLGFGVKANVFDAWSGAFESVGAEASLPILSWFSGGLTYFQSPDHTIRGMNATTSIGMSLLATPVVVTASRGMWVPFDAGTERMKWSVLGYPKVTVEHGQVNGHTYEYLQYHPRFGHSLKDAAVGLGTGILRKTGTHDPKAVAAAELGVAIGLLRDAKKAISALCK